MDGFVRNGQWLVTQLVHCWEPPVFDREVTSRRTRPIAPGNKQKIHPGRGIFLGLGFLWTNALVVGNLLVIAFLHFYKS